MVLQAAGAERQVSGQQVSGTFNTLARSHQTYDSILSLGFRACWRVRECVCHHVPACVSQPAAVNGCTAIQCLSSVFLMLWLMMGGC